MTAATITAPAQPPQYVPTADDCHVNTAAIFVGADGALELVEWAPDDLVPQDVTFSEAQKLAAKSDFAGGGWQVASGHEWDDAFDRSKYNPTSDLPGVKSRAYWTRDAAPSSSDVAIVVSANRGGVGWYSRRNRFRVRFSRRVPASQFLTLGG